METFSMSRKEVPRAGLLKAELVGRITNAQGALALGLAVRECRRLKRRFREGGARGLLHALRGRPGNRQLAPQARAQIATLMTTTYAGFNDVHLTEKLREVHALVVSRSSVRTLRRTLGRPAKRRRRAPKHRSRRPRKAALGQLAQLDASPFAWFEDRGPAATLHGLIDDATSTPLALWFRPHEDLHGYVAVLPEFLADFPRRFARPPADATPAWRPAPRDLDQLLSCRYPRTVARDNTVPLGLRWVQIPPGRGGRSYSGCRVEVRELLDGRLLVFYQGALLARQPSPGPAFVLRPRQGPGETRRRPRRAALSQALRSLERAQFTRNRALAPMRAEPAGPGRAQRRDRAGGPSLATPAATHQ